jgi:flagellar hook-associated protein 3 FlgL
VAAERLAGTQFEISFSPAASGGSLTYTITSGAGAPGSPGFTASQGVVASGGFTPGSDLVFDGMDVRIDGSPAAGDSFVVQSSQNTSIFQTLGNLAAALTMPQGLSNQQIQSVLGGLDQAQNSILLAQASLGANLSEIQTIQQQDGTTSTDTQVQISNLQSANLPEVMANYSESVTALQASEQAFARVQNLTLFSVIGA